MGYRLPDHDIAIVGAGVIGVSAARTLQLRGLRCLLIDRGDPGQGTSDHGWDIAKHRQKLTEVVGRLKAKGFRVALFIDADPTVAALAKTVGATRVELYTGPFGAGLTPAARAPHLLVLAATAAAAKAAGLGVNAGHDLTRENLPELCAAIPHLMEVSIGHALVGDALTFGMAETVRMFRRACGEAGA